MRRVLHLQRAVQTRGTVSIGGTTRLRDYKSYGALRAIDPLTGERKWEFRYPTSSSSGVLTTASGLVFWATATATSSRWTLGAGSISGITSSEWVFGPRRNDLHGRRPPVSPHTVRKRADGLCAAAVDGVALSDARVAAIGAGLLATEVRLNAEVSGILAKS